jgi:hypothetical protein
MITLYEEQIARLFERSPFYRSLRRSEYKSKLMDYSEAAGG